MRNAFTLPAVLALAACAPNPTAPVNVMALVEGPGGTYQPTQVQLTTVQDVVALKGPFVSIVGGARITLDSNDPGFQDPNLTTDRIRTILLKSAGQSVTANYIEKDVLWPADFDTWNMVSAYYSMEQAFAYYQGLGVFSADAISGNTLYYWPTFTVVQTSSSPETDNALFFAPLQSFLLLPFDAQLPLVPLAMNSAVLTHEYSHRVFNLTAYQGQLFPQALLTWQGSAPSQFDMLKSIDEGLADFHAYGASCLSATGCSTRFLESSLGTTVADQRDMARADKCMTAELRNALCTLGTGDFLGASMQYQVGTNLAAALYHAGETAGRQAMQRAVLFSYTDASTVTPGFQQQLQLNLGTPQCVTFGSMMNTLLLHITDPALQQATCNEIMDHLQLTRGDLCPAAQPPCQPMACGCPATSVSPGACLSINNPDGSNPACAGF